MALPKIQTGSSFEFDSFWCIAGRGPENAQGRLSYDPATGVELSVVDLREAGAADFFGGPDQLEVLHGHDLHGKPCTLFDSIATETEGGLFGGHVRDVLSSNRLVHGAHLNSIDDLEVGHVVVDLWGLTEWVNGIWESETPRGSSQLPDGDVLNVPLDGAHLLVQRGIADRDGRYAQHLREAHVTAQFILSDPTTYADFSERFVRPLRDLMVLATGRQVEVDAVTVLVETEEEKPLGGEPLRVAREIRIVERTSLDRPSPQLPRPQIPMPLLALGDSAPAVIARWFELRKELGGPANLLFATLNKKNVSLEDDVLNLLSVAEGYHRRMFDEPPFSKEDHEEIMSLVRGLPDEARRDHYLARLRHANEQSQKRRVRALFERSEKVLPEAEGWRRKQLQPLIDTRNFLTHWGEPTDSVLEGWDLWFALNRLRAILEINLCLDIRLEAETIARVLRVAYGERGWMGPA